MAPIFELEKFQTKSISIFYRFVIVIYGITLLYFSDESYDFWINAGIIGVYFLLFYLLSEKNLIKSILRLISDFLFIYFILYQCSAFGLLQYSFLFLPILNSQNHSGPKKTLLLYIFPILILVILEDFTFNWTHLIPFAFFYVINKWGAYRIKYFRFQQKLNYLIDEFFIKNYNLKKTYLIYRELMKLLNGSKIFYNVISDIICVHVENNNISLVNSSKFIWSIRFVDEKSFLEKAQIKKPLKNVKILVDDDKIENNLIINSVFEGQTYSYILVSKKPFVYFDNFKIALIIRLLTPFFRRYSKILISNYEHKKNEIGQLASLQEKVNYVANSVNSMHFIRNKLGPITNYLAMSKDYETSGDEKKKVIGPFLKSEREKLQSSINQILDRANYILKKSNNPFNVYELEEFGLQQLYSEVRRIWNHYFERQNFKIEWNVKNEDFNVYIYYNSIGLDFVLNNWLSNMSKNHSGHYEVVFTEDEKYYIIKFINSVNLESENFKFIEEFNSSDRDEIARRNSHGLLEIKDFINQMDLKAIIKREGDFVNFILSFKKHYTEDGNINY